MLLPLYKNNDGDGSSAGNIKLTGIRALSQSIVPNSCLIFPGSFNPPHAGHLALANASIKTLERLEPYVHRKHNDKPVLFELSLINADKPSVDPKIVVSRVKHFLELSSESNGAGGPSSLPQQWGVVLTRAPLFEEKLKILRSKVPDDPEEGGPKINFVIGTDTLVRILNPKYYLDKARDSMIKSLLDLKLKRGGFIVGGRLEQSQSPSSHKPPRFVSGRDELVGLPDDVASIFTIMTESEFRADLSSTEIRRKQQERIKEEAK